MNALIRILSYRPFQIFSNLCILALFAFSSWQFKHLDVSENSYEIKYWILFFSTAVLALMALVALLNFYIMLFGIPNWLKSKKKA